MHKVEQSTEMAVLRQDKVLPKCLTTMSKGSYIIGTGRDEG